MTTADTFRASLKRCLATPDFMKDFYSRFMGSSEEIRAKFVDTDFERQNRILVDSLLLMATAAQSAPEAIAWREMKHIALRHRELGIVGPMYDVWLDCLLAATRSHDGEWSDEIAEAWRETLRPGIEFMRART
jgi:hemoglobin-like flavoprotein